MRSYAEIAIFDPYYINVFNMAIKLVEKASNDDKIDDKVIRCHELARAVANVLSGHNLQVVDGKLEGIEHTWLAFAGNIGDPNSKHILDVYVPGRMPQVQLIHDHFFVAKQYKAGHYRHDVDHAIVQKLAERMRS